MAQELGKGIGPVLRTACVHVTGACVALEAGKVVTRATLGRLPLVGRAVTWVTRVAIPTPVYGTAIGVYLAFRWGTDSQRTSHVHYCRLMPVFGW